MALWTILREPPPRIRPRDVNTSIAPISRAATLATSHPVSLGFVYLMVRDMFSPQLLQNSASSLFSSPHFGQYFNASTYSFIPSATF